MSFPRYYFPKPLLILFESRALPVELLNAPLLPPRKVSLFEFQAVPIPFGTRPGWVVLQAVDPIKTWFFLLGLAVSTVARVGGRVLLSALIVSPGLGAAFSHVLNFFRQRRYRLHQLFNLPLLAVAGVAEAA